MQLCRYYRCGIDRVLCRVNLVATRKMGRLLPRAEWVMMAEFIPVIKVGVVKSAVTFTRSAMRTLFVFNPFYYSPSRLVKTAVAMTNVYWRLQQKASSRNCNYKEIIKPSTPTRNGLKCRKIYSKDVSCCFCSCLIR